MDGSMKPHIKKINNLWQCCTPSRVSEWAVGATPKESYEGWERKREVTKEYLRLRLLVAKELKARNTYLYKGA